MTCGFKGSTHHLGERGKKRSCTSGRVLDDQDRLDGRGAGGGLAALSDGGVDAVDQSSVAALLGPDPSRDPRNWGAVPAPPPADGSTADAGRAGGDPAGRGRRGLLPRDRTTPGARPTDGLAGTGPQRRPPPVSRPSRRGRGSSPRAATEDAEADLSLRPAARGRGQAGRTLVATADRALAARRLSRRAGVAGVARDDLPRALRPTPRHAAQAAHPRAPLPAQGRTTAGPRRARPRPAAPRGPHQCPPGGGG